jgi:hypothetical protein
MLMKHYLILSFLAVQIKQLNKFGSLAHTYACQLLALMRIKLEGTKDDNEALPVFYVVLIFVQVFSRAWFIDHFNWRMRSNPNFGKGTYSHLSPYCSEHIYVMSRDLEAMENGRYKTNPPFAQFM